MEKFIHGYFDFMLDLEDKTYTTIHDSVKDFFSDIFTGEDLKAAADMSTQAIIHQLIVHHAQETGITFSEVMKDIIEMEKEAEKLKEAF